MFPNALSLENINQNPDYTQTCSADNFRQKCSMLRLLLVDIAKNLPLEARVVDIPSWGDKANDVWTAVQEKDDLVMLQDL